MDSVSLVHQSVHQPVPIVGGLDDDALQGLAVIGSTTAIQLLVSIGLSRGSRGRLAGARGRTIIIEPSGFDSCSQ